MVTFNNLSPLEQYWQYLESVSFSLPREALDRLWKCAENTNWDEPESALDFNNFAVMALIEAESTDDLSMRSFNLEMALESLETGAKEHPLCAAHLGLLNAIIGNSQKAIEIAFSNLVNNFTLTDYKSDDQTLGLIYLPQKIGIFSESQREQLENILMAKNSYEQALILSTEVLREANLVFYNSTGLRFLTLAQQFAPKSSSINLELGLSSCFNNLWEGLTYLHKAYQLNPDSGAIVQALYLVYRYLKQENFSDYWYNKGLNSYQAKPESLEWKWCSLPLNHPFTYLPFDDQILLTVESNLKSIVTSVLLAQGDWFEKEMELWRNQVQAGMTVIDVGANVGVYTFSAAKKVGKTGKVLAVEPFNTCVKCLQETCKINDFSWVKIYEAAASDHKGVGKLSLHNANELNEVITDESIAADNLVSINLLTLDSLIETENLTQVDWLKIDAEGHEMQVLQGAWLILQKFKPKIMYENIAGSKGSNIWVAQYLLTIGYELFFYQPLTQELISLESLEALSGRLNIIAIPNQITLDIRNLPKAEANDFVGRFREILADPNNKYIPRCENAGRMENGHIIMHNGLKVFPTYYDNFSQILILNKGVHEPQEERMFMEVLKYIKSGGTMIELGSYWSFYSMWFQQQVTDAKNYMIEPNPDNLRCGMENFKLNNMTGNFVLGMIGEEGININNFMSENNISYIDLLHLDIQGSELYFLKTTENIFLEKKVGYVFISTHSQDLHLECKDFLENHDYLILASADFDNETFCYDGVIVARDAKIEGLNPIQIDIRKSSLSS